MTTRYLEEEPTLQRVIDLKEAKIKEFGPQNEIDERVLAFYMLKNKGDVAVTKKLEKRGIRPVRTGALSRRLNRDYALTQAIPTLRAVPRTRKQEDIDHADKKLEPWLAGDWIISQVGDVWGQQNFEAHLFGRGVSYKSPLPRLWADGPYQKLIDRLKEAMKADNAGEELVKAQEALVRFKSNNYPIRWRHVSAMNTWPVESDEYKWPEVVSITRKTRRQILLDYSVTLKSGWSDRLPWSDKDETEEDVTTYDNYRWHAVVIGGKDNAEFAFKPWRHDMGMNPNIWLIFREFPKNEWGLRWRSAFYGELELAETMDEGMTDIRHNIRENTVKGRVFYADPEHQIPSVAAAGAPEQVNIGAGQDHTFWKGLKPDLMPAPEITSQMFDNLRLVQTELDRATIISQLDEAPRSGESAASYSMGIQVAKQQFSQVQQAQIATARDLCMAAFRSVIALSEGFPDAPDAVEVIQPKKFGSDVGAIALSPKDVQDWLSPALIQPRIAAGLLTSQQLMIAMASNAKNELGMAPEFWMSYMDVEDVQYQIELMDGLRMKEGLMPVAIEEMKRRFTAATQAVSPQELAAMLQRLSEVSPEMLQAVLGNMQAPAAPAPMPTPNGGSGIDVANMSRMGAIQEPNLMPPVQ